MAEGESDGRRASLPSPRRLSIRKPPPTSFFPLLLAVPFHLNTTAATLILDSFVRNREQSCFQPDVFMNSIDS